MASASAVPEIADDPEPAPALALPRDLAAAFERAVDRLEQGRPGSLRMFLARTVALCPDAAAPIAVALDLRAPGWRARLLAGQPRALILPR